MNSAPEIPRSFVIGSRIAVPSASWADLKVPNLADFDVVIVNGVTLLPLLRAAKDDASGAKDEWNRLDKRVDRMIERVRDRLGALLTSGGAVYAIIPAVEYFYFERPGKPPHHGELDAKTLLPLSVEVEAEQGDTVEVLDEAFGALFCLGEEMAFYVQDPPSPVRGERAGH